jgi:hypothetical protein
MKSGYFRKPPLTCLPIEDGDKGSSQEEEEKEV